MPPSQRQVLSLAAAIAIAGALLVGVSVGWRAKVNSTPIEALPTGALAAVHCRPTESSWLSGLGSQDPIQCTDQVDGTRGGGQCRSQYFYTSTLVSSEAVVPSEIQYIRTESSLWFSLTRTDADPDDPSAKIEATMPRIPSGSGPKAYDECTATGCREHYAPANATLGGNGRIEHVEVPGRELISSDEWYIACTFHWQG